MNSALPAPLTSIKTIPLISSFHCFSCRSRPACFTSFLLFIASFSTTYFPKNVRKIFWDGIYTYLACKWAAEVHGATPGLVGLQPQHAGAGELVVSRSSWAFLLNFNYMDRVPAALDLLWVPVTSLLDKNNSWKWWWCYMVNGVSLFSPPAKPWSRSQR